MKFYFSNGEFYTTIYQVTLYIYNEPIFGKYFFTLKGANKFYDKILGIYKDKMEEFFEPGKEYNLELDGEPLVLFTIPFLRKKTE